MRAEHARAGSGLRHPLAAEVEAADQAGDRLRREGGDQRGDASSGILPEDDVPGRRGRLVECVAERAVDVDIHQPRRDQPAADIQPLGLGAEVIERGQAKDRSAFDDDRLPFDDPIRQDDAAVDQGEPPAW